MNALCSPVPGGNRVQAWGDEEGGNSRSYKSEQQQHNQLYGSEQYKYFTMDLLEFVTIIFLPVAVFVFVFVAMWWCLFYGKKGGGQKKKKNHPVDKEVQDSVLGLEIAKTASREDSERGGSPSVGFEPSVLTEEPFPPIKEEDDKRDNSPKVKKLFVSSRWEKTEGEQIEDIEEGVAHSIDDEDLTFDNGNGAFPTMDDEDQPARSPTGVIKGFLSRKSMSSASSSPKKDTAVPREIFSATMDFSEMESHPDDETEGGLGNNKDNDNNTLASNDIYVA